MGKLTVFKVIDGHKLTLCLDNGTKGRCKRIAETDFL